MTWELYSAELYTSHLRKESKDFFNLHCHICKAALQAIKIAFIPLDARPQGACIWGIALLTQVVIETTAQVRLSLWAIKQYQSPNHTVSAHWFDLIKRGEEGAVVHWGNMSAPAAS